MLGRPWAPAHAYRWIRFESPDPFGALLDAGERMEALWREDGAAGTLFAEREAADLEPLEAMARGLGYAGG